MDLRTVLTFSSLLLMTAGADQPNSTTTPIHTETDSTNKDCTCRPSAAPAAPATPVPTPSRSEPDLGFFTIKWTKCVGYINLIVPYTSNSSLTVCDSGKTIFENLLRDVCVNRKGCEDTKPDLAKGKIQKNGYDITASGEKKVDDCNALRVQCKVEVLQDVEGQLHAYKVVTALLCCMLLILLLIRFTRPTVKALQKRLSDRRQNRWIGPTQSHSVSYHRGKSAVKNNDAEKRVSYPALERLAVSDSREPSSNRNSDYNF